MVASLTELPYPSSFIPQVNIVILTEIITTFLGMLCTDNYDILPVFNALVISEMLYAPLQKKIGTPGLFKKHVLVPRSKS
jgi:hypothetical protein